MARERERQLTDEDWLFAAGINGSNSKGQPFTTPAYAQAPPPTSSGFLEGGRNGVWETVGAKTLFHALTEAKPSLQTTFWCPNTVSDAFCTAIHETSYGARHEAMSQRFVRAILDDQREKLRECGFAFTEEDVPTEGLQSSGPRRRGAPI